MAFMLASYRVPSPNGAVMLPDTSTANWMFVSDRFSLGGPFRCGRDLVEVAADRSVAVAETPDRELCPACDDREQVVEVVGDTARELAHRFHALSVAQLLFEVQPLRQILDHDDREARIGLGVHDERGRNLTQPL